MTIVARRPFMALARFAISKLKGSFTMMSDNSMRADVKLFDCNLDDIRPDYQNGITKYDFLTSFFQSCDFIFENVFIHIHSGL